MTKLLIVHGEPRTKKNSPRILRNQKTGKPFVAQSEAHNLWAQKAIWLLKSQWRAPSIAAPVNMAAVVYRSKNVGDLLNFLAGISDALEHAGVIQNDRLIVALDGSRMAIDVSNPRVEIALTILEANTTQREK